MWGVEILRKIDETANLASEEIKVGNMQGIDSSIQYITHIWQTYVDQEQTIFDGEMVKNDSLGILINIVSSNIQYLKDANLLKEANKIQLLFDELSSYLKGILQYISKPVLLVFMGAKCKSWPNCKAGQRTIESVDNIVAKFAARIRISIVDVKKKKELTKQYKIMFTPTLVYIDTNGKEVYRKPGESTDLIIEDELNKLISK